MEETLIEATKNEAKHGSVVNLASTENQNQDSASYDQNGDDAHNENINNIIEIPSPTDNNPDELKSNTRNEKEVIDHPEGGGNPDHTAVVPPPDRTMMHENIHVAKTTMLIGLFILILGSSFAALCALKNQHVVVGSKKLRLRVRDILNPDKWPEDFFPIVLFTVGFTVSLVVTVILIWSVLKERSFCFLALVFVAVNAFFLSYVFILKEKVPKFWLGTESFSISSFWLVWLYGSSLVFLVVAMVCIIWAVAHRIIRSSCLRPKGVIRNFLIQN